jgi:hypothetical protein
VEKKNGPDAKMAAGPVSLEIYLFEGFGLFETGHAGAFFPIAAFFEDFNPLKAFQDATFGSDCTGALQTVVL